MISTQPLISVIVPVYKVESYLADCIESIIAQSYKNLEIILVDDGSPDSSGKICDSYAQKDSRIKVIHKENGGVSSARNAALDAASGAYIGFADSDDTLRPEMFEHLYRELTENTADISICKAARIERGEKNVEGDIFSLSLSPEEAIKNILIGKYFGGQLWNKLFKKEVLDGLRFDEDIHVYEDMIFTVRAILKSSKICYTSRVLYNYFIRETSVFRSNFSERQLTAHTACLRAFDALKENSLSHLKKYSDTQILLCNLTFMHRLFYSPSEVRKKYCNLVRKNIKAHLTKESFSRLTRENKLKIVLIAINYRLYFLTLKVYSRKRSNDKGSGCRKGTKDGF